MKKNTGQSKCARLWVSPQVEIATVCMYCGHQKQKPNHWQPPQTSTVERLSHGVCPPCFNTAIRGIVGEMCEEQYLTGVL